MDARLGVVKPLAGLRCPVKDRVDSRCIAFRHADTESSRLTEGLRGDRDIVTEDLIGIPAEHLAEELVEPLRDRAVEVDRTA